MWQKLKEIRVFLSVDVIYLRIYLKLIIIIIIIINCEKYKRQYTLRL
jgi:hypothetical protein